MSFTTIEQADISRGNIVSNNKNSVIVSNQFLAKILWFSSENWYSGRVYSLYRSGFLSDAFLFSKNKKFNFKAFSYRNTNTIRKYDVGLFKISLTEKLAFTLYNENKYFGSFILIDKVTKNTLGAGTIIEALNNKARIPQQHISTIKKERALIKKQKPFVLWFTGISGAGKTTIANILETLLVKLQKHTYILDGDNIRGINKDLKFDVIDRIENIRRVTEIAKLFVDAGIITIVALISPFRAEREEAKNKFEKK